MDSIFTYPREEYKVGNGPKPEDLLALIVNHRDNMRPKLVKALEYYRGKQKKYESDSEIETVVSNHAKDISDVASSYFLGSPITYGIREGADITDEQRISFQNEIERSNSAETDDENSLFASVCGLAHDYTYAEEGEPHLLTKAMSPLDTFVVVDQSIEQNELFGVNYYTVKNKENTEKDGKIHALVADREYLYKFEGLEDGGDLQMVGSPIPHYLGFVPITEYRNNKFCIGDAEPVFDLIDAYNELTTCRVRDKRQFVDAILVIYGTLLADEGESKDEAMDNVERLKLLELDEDTKAEYLTHTLDESGTETLRKALKQDIYTLAHVPNLADENFAGNSSGVAMEYKLLGLEMLTKTKESWYRKGVRKRLKMFLHFLEVKQGIKLDISDIEITFTRALPKNILELSQIAVNLDGKVSRKTLLSLFPFIKNPEQELTELDSEEVKTEENKLKAEGLYANNPPMPNPNGNDGEEDDLDE